MMQAYDTFCFVIVVPYEIMSAISEAEFCALKMELHAPSGPFAFIRIHCVRDKVNGLIDVFFGHPIDLQGSFLHNTFSSFERLLANSMYNAVCQHFSLTEMVCQYCCRFGIWRQRSEELAFLSEVWYYRVENKVERSEIDGGWAIPVER
jgi:hypothetical protein